ATLVATYFAVALAAASTAVLDGRNATVGGATAVASARLGAIAGWAVVLTTVNLVIQALRSRAGIIGSLLLGAATVAWGLATFLVVPIVALEGLGRSRRSTARRRCSARSGASSSSARRRSACCSPSSAPARRGRSPSATSRAPLPARGRASSRP